MEAQRGSRRANALKRELTATAEVTSSAPAEVVYDLLADVRSHLVWGGERQRSKTRLLSVDAPEGPARVGTEFRTEGADPMGRFADASVVTEADRPRVFEFVTEARLHTKKGAIADWTNVHRYELEPRGGGCRIRYSIRITRISELPGMLAMFNVSVLSTLAMSAAKGLSKRGLRNLAGLAEEPVGTHAKEGEA